MFEAPIPGQSLTDTPKNAPYERPPELSDPREVLAYHMNRLQNEEVLDAVLTFVEFGIDLKNLTETITSASVMEGIHSIDTGLMVAPAIHEFIRIAAQNAGIEYDEGFVNKNEQKQAEEFKIQMLSKKMSGKDLSEGQKEEQTELVESVEEEEPAEKPAGLMQRSVK